MRRAALLGYLVLTGCTPPEDAAAPATPRETAAPAPPPARTAPSGPVTISVLTTNDVHGQLERLTVFGGFLKNLEAARKRDGAVLLVDGGDAIEGTIESNSNEGYAVIAAYGALGYRAMTLGNHEFDFGPSGPDAVPRTPNQDPQGALRARLSEAHFPVIAANLVGTDGRTPPWSNLEPSAIVDVRGVKVGLVGLITADAPEVIKRQDFAGLSVTPLGDAAAREAKFLRSRGADLVIVVAHAGGHCTRFDDPKDLSSCEPESEIFRLAEGLPAGLVDAIVGGHRDAAVAHFVAGIPIVHARSNLVAFSRVDLTYDPEAKKTTAVRIEPPHELCQKPWAEGCAPGSYEGADVVPSQAVAAAIQPALEAARDLREKSIGVEVVAPFTAKKDGETALGNLFADLMREAEPKADLAFGNAGSVRADLPSGALQFGQLHEVMPFDNQLARVHLTGAELKAALLKNLTEAKHGILSVSGLTAIVRCKGAEPEIRILRRNGAPVQDGDALVAVTNDFMASGGDGLLPEKAVASDRVEIDGGKTAMAALMEGLARRGTVRPDDPRLFDARRPRIRLPAGFPVKCGAN